MDEEKRNSCGEYGTERSRENTSMHVCAHIGARKDRQQDRGMRRYTIIKTTSCNHFGACQVITHLDKGTNDTKACEAEIFEGTMAMGGVQEGVQEQGDVSCT